MMLHALFAFLGVAATVLLFVGSWWLMVMVGFGTTIATVLAAAACLTFLAAFWLCWLLGGEP